MKIILALFSYLLGSIPMGYLIFFISEKKDIRNYGSRTIGATNVLRLKGWKFAFPVLAADFLKGFLPVLLALKIFEDIRLAVLCAFLAVVGHCFPVYIRFKGGKGVATTVGIYAILALKPLLFSLGLFFIVVFATRYVSLASLLSMLSIPLFVYLLRGKEEIIGLSTAIFLLIVIKHRENIKRLIKGTERKIGEKVK